MQQTTNYNLLIPEGTDVVNPLTQVNPNFQTIDGAMFANKQASIGTASEVVTGTVHAIIRNNTDSDVFRFTATGAWTAGDTMTLDGQSVTVHLSDGTTPATNSYIIGAEVLAMVNGSLVTLAISSTPPAQGVTSFNNRTGAVVPAASDYDASMIDYDNTGSGLTATDVQSAIDEIASGGSSGGLVTLWTNPNPGADFAAQTITINGFDPATSAGLFLIHADYQAHSSILKEDVSFIPIHRLAVQNVLQEIGMSGNFKMSENYRIFTPTYSGGVLSIVFNDSLGGVVNNYGSAPTYAEYNGTLIPTQIINVLK